MRVNWILLALLGTALMAAGMAVAQEAPAAEQDKLEVGDKAPALDLTDWVQGKPFTLEKGKIYIIEFWATWCPPCRYSIPHLNDVYKKYKEHGVEILAVSTEAPEKVKPFVKEMGEQMTYPVASDGERTTAMAYMAAAGVDVIPYAFIIDREGKIAWQSHPMDKRFADKLKEMVPEAEKKEEETEAAK